MNDRHPSGVPSPDDDSGAGFSYEPSSGDYGQSAYGAYGEAAYSTDPHGGYSVGAYDSTVGHAVDAYGSPTGAYASYGDDDPLFGTLPGAGAHAGAVPQAGTGGYPSAGWENTAAGYAAYDGSGSWDAGYGTQPTGDYSTGDYSTGDYSVPAQAGPEQAHYGYPAPDDGTGQWTFGVQDAGQQTAAWDTSSWNGGWDAPGEGAVGVGAVDAATAAGTTAAGAGTADWYVAEWNTAGWDNGGWHAGAWETDGQGAAYGYESPDGHEGHAGLQAYDGYGFDGLSHTPGQEQQFAQDSPPQHQHQQQDFAAQQGSTAQWDFSELAEHQQAYDEAAPASDMASSATSRVVDEDAAEGEFPDEHDVADSSAPVALGTVGSGPSARGRRRSPKPRPRRRALMTVAVPSVAVMGVAGAAAASVMGGDDGDGSKDSGTTTVAAPDAAPVKPSSANNKLDTQLAGLSADADDFADRASRTQERIDLKQRQEAEKERKAKEAARKEAMRPKFVLPVKNHTLSARYGQAGVNWMSVHTGIDFPVSYGTSVMAATDGTVSTKYDASYGNMAIVTAKDGTQTWYCHLSSNKIRSGQVKAGDVIAYSGSSGNSTGPHLHFEVRPGGGSAVDPIPWLQSKGLNIS
ncbi:M23 family metallopeptidase [Streptomyces tubbatahanensis]|uniref:M23 family metallopeptidase n=1 Tax=Streptomyces tubbatahanensis TaxID=2923272 RepID=A0ABY3Y344_9ACTN|nr:M23 family metallopeptidase [Streptomyces tubbatahanensis]UNT01168.1 M23 family metallopeptidase [Streptomyces tubbatahanensis]